MEQVEQKVKERPILFQTPMVRAILDDRKDLTRRTKGLEEINKNPDEWALVHCGIYEGTLKNGANFSTFGVIFQNKATKKCVDIPCPYGGEGHILWVRETWAYYRPFAEDRTDRILYKADLDHCHQCPLEIDGERVWVNVRDAWRPSIFMPREACRLKLKIESITVERLQGITEEDAIREGIEIDEWTWGPIAYPDGTIDKSLVGNKTKWYRDYSKREKHWSAFGARESFRTLFQSINGPESWKANSWVWRIAFSKI